MQNDVFVLSGKNGPQRTTRINQRKVALTHGGTQIPDTWSPRARAAVVRSAPYKLFPEGDEYHVSAAFFAMIYDVASRSALTRAVRVAWTSSPVKSQTRIIIVHCMHKPIDQKI